MVVRIVHKTGKGWKADFFNTKSIKDAEAFAAKKFSKTEHEVQYDETQQAHLMQYSGCYRTI